MMLIEIRSGLWAAWKAIGSADRILRRAPYRVRYGALYRCKVKALVQREPLADHLREVVPGDRIMTTDKDRPWMQRTMLVVVSAYKNRFGEWVPPYVVDATGEYLGDDAAYRKTIGGGK